MLDKSKLNSHLEHMDRDTRSVVLMIIKEMDVMKAKTPIAPPQQIPTALVKRITDLETQCIEIECSIKELRGEFDTPFKVALETLKSQGEILVNQVKTISNEILGQSDGEWKMREDYLKRLDVKVTEVEALIATANQLG